jgi:hypothetical protein
MLRFKITSLFMGLPGALIFATPSEITAAGVFSQTRYPLDHPRTACSVPLDTDKI